MIRNFRLEIIPLSNIQRNFHWHFVSCTQNLGAETLQITHFSLNADLRTDPHSWKSVKGLHRDFCGNHAYSNRGWESWAFSSSHSKAQSTNNQPLHFKTDWLKLQIYKPDDTRKIEHVCNLHVYNVQLYKTSLMISDWLWYLFWHSYGNSRIDYSDHIISFLIWFL